MAIQSSREMIADSTRTPGDTNWEGKGFDLHPQVFTIASIIIVGFVVMTLGMEAIQEGWPSEVFGKVLTFISDSFGWFFILAGNIYLLVMIFLAFSKYGHIRLGGQDAEPEFSTPAWAAMLLSAGMGIGIMFWGVGEPIFHFQAPPPMFNVEAETQAAAQVAMGTTFFHWSLHAWGIYAVVGLSLAFFAFNWGLPLTIRSVFYPILGENIHGWPGHTLDVLAVVATLFGLATSLGLGAQQAMAGFNFLFGLPNEPWTQVVLIAIITGFATISVVRGLEGGVKVLSEGNMMLAAVFMVFVLLTGPTLFILGSLVQNIGFYLETLPQFSFWTETYEGTSWQNSWTVFYWGWWISWSPFVGMFIARVSKGRTVREFILGVMFIPALLTAIWMSVFGGAALHIELNPDLYQGSSIIEAVNANVATAMYIMLESFPLTQITSLVSIVLVMVFFVTSSDSGSLVVDSLTAGGKLDAPVPQRIFWAVTEGAVGAVLLIGGGLGALQTAAITTGLPFAIVLLIMCFSLIKGLDEELQDLEAGEDTAINEPVAIGAPAK